MAESTDDKQVDSAIDRMQALLDELKKAQAKDVEDESGEEDAETPVADQPKDFKDARIRVRQHFRRPRGAEDQQ